MTKMYHRLRPNPRSSAIVVPVDELINACWDRKYLCETCQKFVQRPENDDCKECGDRVISPLRAIDVQAISIDMIRDEDDETD